MHSMPDLLAAWSRAWHWLAGVGAGAASAERPPFASEYDAIYADLDPDELSGNALGDDDLDLSLEMFRADRKDRRFLGTYTEEGGQMAFERYGFFDLLRARGFEPVMKVDVSDSDLHRLRIYDREPTVERLLIELSIGLDHTTLPNDQPCRFLFVNWLLMQNPREEFTEHQVPLPDQAHPGLGMFVRFAYLLKLMADRIGCDGLLNHPAYPHNGVLYGKVCHFIDPEVEARFRALERDLGTADLAWLTAEVQAGRVLDRWGQPFIWKPASQVMPVSRAARRWFEASEYTEQVEKLLHAYRYHHVDHETRRKVGAI